MDRHDLRDLLVEGLDVYGADGSKLGSIIALAPDRIVVEKGFFFPTDYAIPLTSVSRVDADRVWLTVPKAAALQQQWDRTPHADAADGARIAPLAPAATDQVAPLRDEGIGPATAEAIEPIRRYSTDNTQDTLPNA